MQKLISVFLVLMLMLNVSAAVPAQAILEELHELSERSSDNGDQGAKEKNETEKSSEVFKRHPHAGHSGWYLQLSSLHFAHISYLVSERHRSLLEIPPEA